MFKTSRYTFSIQARTGLLLYNANTGAVIQLSGKDARRIAKSLAGSPRRIDARTFPEHLEHDLLESGMLIPVEHDELAQIRERFRIARDESPIALTITTTMDCNLGCYYCYEERSGAHLDLEDVDSIVSLAESRLTDSGKHSLHVDWYGGEPLLNLAFLDEASRALQVLCESLSVEYSASIISNGTCWPGDVGEFVRSHRIRQVQISFDGLEAAHNKRRRYRTGRAPGENASSFARAVELVDELLLHVRVDVRFNMDRANVRDLPGFLAMMRERGWFSRPYPVVVQPARLSAYSERSAFMRRSELSADEYEDLREQVRRSLSEDAPVEEAEVPDGFPYPRTSVCAAIAHDSVVVGADGELYRCGLQVGEQNRSVGQLSRQTTRRNRSLPLFGVGTDDSVWWKQFDPTQQPKCARCSFLPICWSGCPKKHLEGDTHAVDEQGAYWRRNLPRLVARRVGVELRPDSELTFDDQFRSEELALSAE